MAQVIMVLGTTAGAGKSIFCTALCRFFADLGLRVAPFAGLGRTEQAIKLPEGLLLDRDVILAAEAARTSPLAAMNPLLVREENGTPVLTGSGSTKLPAKEGSDPEAAAYTVLLSALEELRAKYDVIVAGGSGNPTDTYRFGADFATMRLAAAADAPVVLVADIDRGGVYASVAGTLELLAAEDRKRILGIVINRFRGNLELLQPGLLRLSEITGKPVLGVLPYLHNMTLPEAAGTLPESTHREEYYRRLARHFAQYTDTGLLQKMLLKKQLSQPPAKNGRIKEERQRIS